MAVFGYVEDTYGDGTPPFAKFLPMWLVCLDPVEGLSHHDVVAAVQYH